MGVARRRPGLIIEGIRAFLGNRRRGRILPSSSYLAWRSHTAYGSVAPVATDDLIEFLAWRRSMRRLRVFG
jgi:hypothetical protein